MQRVHAHVQTSNDDDFLPSYELEEATAEPDPWPSTRPGESGVQNVREAIVQRLSSYAILPPNAPRLSDETLDGIEQVFVTLAELVDDDSRRRALPLLFQGETQLRGTLLAIVPIFYDELFFDTRTPTRDLVELILIAHAKWRRRFQLR